MSGWPSVLCTPKCLTQNPSSSSTLSHTSGCGLFSTAHPPCSVVRQNKKVRRKELEKAIKYEKERKRKLLVPSRAGRNHRNVHAQDAHPSPHHTLHIGLHPILKESVPVCRQLRLRKRGKKPPSRNLRFPLHRFSPENHTPCSHSSRVESARPLISAPFV